MTQVSEALGQKIREIRKNRRCTLEELGQAVHKSKATLSKYETGDIVIDVERMDAKHLGALLYFYMRACAMSGYLNKINPFNQPGVEIYKKNMFHLLGKPGY